MNSKSCLVVFALLCSSALLAQTNERSNLTPYFSAILVEDIEVSRDWYQEMLGFEVVLESEITEGFTILNLKRGNAAIELIQLPGAITPAEAVENYTSRTRIKGLFKIGYQVSDLDQWIDFLNEKDVQFKGDVVEDPVTGKPMVIILDPDGNRIQLFEQ